MFDIGWTEMFVILIVAVIVIGPKDLPRALRTVGQWVGKVRSMGRDFQRGIDEMIREADLDDMKKQLEDTRKIDLKKEVEDTIDPTGSMRESAKPISLDEEPKSKPKTPPAAEKSSPSTGDVGEQADRPAPDVKTGT